MAHINMSMILHATTIVGVRTKEMFCLGGDGQVSMSHTVMKHNAVKVRSLYKDTVLTGFAGATADAFTLYDLFESALRTHQGNLLKASVDLAKQWRRDRVLRRLEANMIVGDAYQTYILTGQGDVIAPDSSVVSIGSGGDYARSAALALCAHTDLGAEDIVRGALGIASDICLYTNTHFTIKSIQCKDV